MGDHRLPSPPSEAEIRGDRRRPFLSADISRTLGRESEAPRAAVPRARPSWRGRPLGRDASRGAGYRQTDRFFQLSPLRPL